MTHAHMHTNTYDRIRARTQTNAHLHRVPTGFSFGILVNSPNIPPNFGIPSGCCCATLPADDGDALDGNGGLDGAPGFDVLLLLLLLLFAFAMRPAPSGPLLSTVTVFRSFMPC